MSVKKEQKSEILRKSNKMIDNHREFLDMDTDEENFGHQGKIIKYINFKISFLYYKKLFII